MKQNRINGMIQRIADEEDFDSIKWMLDEPVKNFTQAVVDDTIKANADFQYKAGLRPRIIRKESGNCCDWCRAVVGTYDDYPHVPKDVYKRHRYCRCTVEYDPGDGKRQDVWKNSRKIQKDLDYAEKLRERKELAGQVIKDIRQYNKSTLTALEEKNWESRFKAKAIKFYRDAHDEV